MKLNEITCLSDLYYVIGNWFTGIMVSLAFLFLPISLNHSEGVWSFLMCAGIAFVGVAGNYKDKFTYPVHYISAGISAVSCIIFSIIVNPISLTGLIIGLIGLIDKKRWLLWCEFGFFLSAISSMIIT